MKVLVTGFDPFGNEDTNPSYESVRRLPDEICGAKIIKLEIPTEFEEGSARVENAIKAEKPDIVICVGQAGGRAAVSFERVAINLKEARIPDNVGNQPINEKIQADGENAYFTSLPIKSMVKTVNDGGFPAYISYTAGTFVCNEVMYNLLYTIEKNSFNIKGGFIHVPFENRQVVQKSPETPSMTLEAITKSLEYGIEAAIKSQVDITGNFGANH